MPWKKKKPFWKERTLHRREHVGFVDIKEMSTMGKLSTEIVRFALCFLFCLFIQIMEGVVNGGTIISKFLDKPALQIVIHSIRETRDWRRSALFFFCLFVPRVKKSWWENSSQLKIFHSFHHNMVAHCFCGTMRKVCFYRRVSLILSPLLVFF